MRGKDGGMLDVDCRLPSGFLGHRAESFVDEDVEDEEEVDDGYSGFRNEIICPRCA